MDFYCTPVISYLIYYIIYIRSRRTYIFRPRARVVFSSFPSRVAFPTDRKTILLLYIYISIQYTLHTVRSKSPTIESYYVVDESIIIIILYVRNRTVHCSPSAKLRVINDNDDDEYLYNNIIVITSNIFRAQTYASSFNS